jgi:hypothetical protein
MGQLNHWLSKKRTLFGHVELGSQSDPVLCEHIKSGVILERKSYHAIVHNVACLLKARNVKPAETAVTRGWLREHIHC